MNSDYKYWPTSLPKVLQSGYSNRHKPNVIRTTMSDGYVRQRLVNQGAPDIVTCSVCLIESDYRKFVQWFKGDIRCGQDWFIMPLLSTEGENAIQYKYVRIQNGEVNAALVSTGANTGSIYKLSMTLDVSNTVVDDGSWNPDVPSGGMGDEIVILSESSEPGTIFDDQYDDSVNHFEVIVEE